MRRTYPLQIILNLIKKKMRRIRIPGKLPKIVFPVNYEGAPQRRLYMPEWYVTMVKPDEKNLPKNYVKFHIPADMTKYDLKEYLDKVYGVKVMNIKLTIVGYQKYKFPTPWIKGGYKWEFMDPYHEAHVYLPRGETFEYPDFLKSVKGENKSSILEQYEEMRAQREAEKQEKNKNIESKTVFSNSWLQ